MFLFFPGKTNLLAEIIINNQKQEKKFTFLLQWWFSILTEMQQ